MEVDVQQGLRDDRSANQSFGSNFRPSSQTRKISIGVMVEPVDTRKSGAMKENEGKLQHKGRIYSNTGNEGTQSKRRGEVVTVAEGKQTQAPEQVHSPWITARSFHQKSPASNAVFPLKQASSLLDTSGLKKPYGVKGAGAATTNSVKFFSNQTVKLQNNDSKQMNLDGNTSDIKRGKDGNSERVEFTFRTAERVIESDKLVENNTGKTENIRTETLKMKLWEILGTVSSPKSQHFQACKVSVNHLKPEGIVEHVEAIVLKPRQSSDTIEADSENPQNATMRPVTRSLTKKRVPTKVQKDRTKFTRKQATTKVQLNKTSSTPSSSKKHHQSIFSFKERWSTKLNGDVDSGSSVSRRKKIQKKSSGIGPRKIYFSKEDKAAEIQQRTYRSEALSLPKRTSPGNETGSIHRCLSENRKDFQEKDSHQSPMTNKTDQQANFDTSTLPQMGDQREDFGKPYLKNSSSPQEDFQSPTCGIKTPILSPSPKSTPKSVQINQGACSPAQSGRRFTMGNTWSFRTLHTSRKDRCEPSAETQSSDDTEKLTNFLHRSPMPDGKEESEDELTKSSEKRDSESFEEGSPISKRYDCYREKRNSPEVVISDKAKFMFRPTKRLRSHEDVRVSELSPNSPSSKGGVESDWIKESSEQTQENEFGRAITLFALSLERFKRKMDTATRKKSSEIFMSISEEIKLQVQNAQSQIESDVEKLTVLSKSKRNCLETRFQEQEEQLKMIHEKFKEEIHHHLLNCRSSLEGLEAHQLELKGVVKKQKASHQKLLMQVEEAVETQINNARTRIVAVHELARRKMLQLKHIIAEFLKEDTLS